MLIHLCCIKFQEVLLYISVFGMFFLQQSLKTVSSRSANSSDAGGDDGGEDVEDDVSLIEDPGDSESQPEGDHLLQVGPH